MSILNIDNVSKSFDGFRAIYDLNLAIGKGELRAIGDVLRDQLLSYKRVGFDA